VLLACIGFVFLPFVDELGRQRMIGQSAAVLIESK
jgi:hypothetical protein